MLCSAESILFPLSVLRLAHFHIIITVVNSLDTYIVFVPPTVRHMLDIGPVPIRVCVPLVMLGDVHPNEEVFPAEVFDTFWSDSLVLFERFATCLSDSLGCFERFAICLSDSLVPFERLATLFVKFSKPFRSSRGSPPACQIL